MIQDRDPGDENDAKVRVEFLSGERHVDWAAIYDVAWNALCGPTTQDAFLTVAVMRAFDEHSTVRHA